MAEDLLYKREGHVGTFTLNRPEQRNAFSEAMIAEWVAAIDEARRDDQVRVVVVTGNGSAFCAGGDLAEIYNQWRVEDPITRKNHLWRAIQRVPLGLADLDKPVIAAVNGAAIGAGCVLALVSDILVIAEEAYMSMTEVDYGLAGGVRHVLRSFSPSDARLMIYTARRTSGADLYRMNVASVCVPRERVVAEAQAIGRTIAEKVPLAVVAAKRSFGLTEELPLRDGYRYEQSQTAALAETEDTREALAAFREKRKPVFKGR
jgi:enoyl-CoA hydratase